MTLQIRSHLTGHLSTRTGFKRGSRFYAEDGLIFMLNGTHVSLAGSKRRNPSHPSYYTPPVFVGQGLVSQ